MDPSDFNDFTKNADLIKNIRAFKVNVGENENKLMDIQEIQSEVVKKLTEKDLANSLTILDGKTLELRERLEEAKKHLGKISNTGDEMDGNTSND